MAEKKKSEAVEKEQVKTAAKKEKAKKPAAKAAKKVTPEVAEEKVLNDVPAETKKPKMEAETKPTAKKAREERNVPKERTAKKPKNTVTDALNVGVPSEDILNENAVKKSTKEWEFENYSKLKRFQNDNEILWATVYGVETMGNHVAICAMWNDIKVIIPGEFYFEQNYDFGKRFTAMSPEEKLRKINRTAKYQQGAKVCFTVVDVSCEEIADGQFKGEYLVTVIGNRTKAMEIIRDIYFWHKNRKLDATRTPRTIERGDIVTANVLGVKEDTVLVECAGVETRLGAHNLLQGDIVTNCCDYVKPGDRIKVRVKEVILNEDNTVHLSVTGRTNEATKMISTIRIGSTYLGKVESFNAEKNTYHVLLANGVPATVPRANVRGHIELFRGDRVSFHVSNVYDTFVSGSALKI